jgi:hypothetical protein
LALQNIDEALKINPDFEKAKLEKKKFWFISNDKYEA